MKAALDLAYRPVLSSPAIMTTAEKLKVLIAEDEPAMLSLVSRHAMSLGFSVVEASDGDAAWEMAQKHLPDLVLLDVMMPGMSGWEVCKRIKSNSAFGQTGVIMLTGIGESLNDMTSPLFKADGWLNKPFDFADLDAKVREVLELHDRELPAAHAEEQAEEEEAVEAAPAKKAAKKPAAKKPAAKKPAAKKAAKKPAAKKPAAKKPAAKKSAAKKPAAKKPAAKKTSAKKTATRRRG